jgi:hypothetical protein
MANALLPMPNIAASDVIVPTPTPTPPPRFANNFSGTPGTDGIITNYTFNGAPVPEPHRIWKFKVQLPKWPTLDSSVVMPIVQSIEPGFDNTSPVVHPIGGRHHFQADFFDATELRLLFYGDEGMSPIEYILAWKKLIRNYNSDTGLDDGTYNYPEGQNGYLQKIVVTLQSYGNQDIYQITYKDCFPTTMAPLRLDYEPSGRTAIAQSFAVNRIVTQKLTGTSTSNPNFLKAQQNRITPGGAAFRLNNIQRLGL